MSGQSVSIPTFTVFFVSQLSVGMAQQAAIEKRRKDLRNELAYIENQIFDLEGTYLEETRDFGNIFSGWNSLLSDKQIKVKKQVQNEERLFSLSSVTSPATRRDEKKKQMRAKNAKKKDADEEGAIEVDDDDDDDEEVE